MEEISLRDIIETVLKGKWLLIGIIIICMVLVPFGAYVVNPAKGQVSAIISLSFKGLENGQNPDGSTFDINTITSPNIIQNVIDDLNLDKNKISVDDIKKGFSINPIVPNNIVEQMEALTKEGKTMTYYPTKYVITYTYNKSQGLNKTTAKNILNSVIKEYQEYFVSLYSDKSLLGNALGGINYDDYDYPEIADIMNNQLNVMISYLNGKASEAGNFRSKSTGLTFKDLLDSIDILRNIDVNKMASIIYANNLTKDKEKIISHYEYLVKQNEYDMQKAQGELQVSKDLMTQYKRETNILGMPGTEDQQIQLDNNKSYYDELVKQAKAEGDLAQKYQKQMDYYQKMADKYRNDTVSAEQKQAAEKEVNEMLPSIKEKMQAWIEKVNQTAEDYYEYNYGKSISCISGVTAKAAFNIKLMIAIGFVLGIMIGLFVVFFKEYWKKSGKQKKRIKSKEEAVQNA